MELEATPAAAMRVKFPESTAPFCTAAVMFMGGVDTTGVVQGSRAKLGVPAAHTDTRGLYPVSPTPETVRGVRGPDTARPVNVTSQVFPPTKSGVDAWEMNTVSTPGRVSRAAVKAPAVTLAGRGGVLVPLYPTVKVPPSTDPATFVAVVTPAPTPEREEDARVMRGRFPGMDRKVMLQVNPPWSSGPARDTDTLPTPGTACRASCMEERGGAPPTPAMAGALKEMEPVVNLPPPQAVVSRPRVKDPPKVSPRAALVVTLCTVYRGVALVRRACTSYWVLAKVCTRCTALGPVFTAVVTDCTATTGGAGSHSTR